MRIFRYFLCFLFLIAGITHFYGRNTTLFGVSLHYSFLSSYYSYSQTNGGLQQMRTNNWSDGMGGGIFFDWKFSLYAGIRFRLAFYPNWQTVDNLIGTTFNKIMVEGGVLSKIYLYQQKKNDFSFWFGFGPMFQVMLSQDINYMFNNYVLNLQLAFGTSFRLVGNIYVLPELFLGTNLYFNSADFNQVMQNLINTSDVLERGFNFTFKIGIAYKKDFVKKRKVWKE